MRQNGNQPVISLRGEIFILRMNLEQRNQFGHQKKKPEFPKEKGVKEGKKDQINEGIYNQNCFTWNDKVTFMFGCQNIGKMELS